jgi:hypothetical protein
LTVTVEYFVGEDKVKEETVSILPDESHYFHLLGMGYTKVIEYNQGNKYVYHLAKNGGLINTEREV